MNKIKNGRFMKGWNELPRILGLILDLYREKLGQDLMRYPWYSSIFNISA